MLTLLHKYSMNGTQSHVLKTHTIKWTILLWHNLQMQSHVNMRAHIHKHTRKKWRHTITETWTTFSKYMLLRWYYLLVLMVLPYVANHHLCTFNKRAIPGYNKSIWNHLVFDPPSREKDKRITQWWRIITTKYKLPWSLYFSKINQPINAYMLHFFLLARVNKN